MSVEKKEDFALYAINRTESERGNEYEIEIQDAVLLLTTGSEPTCELSFQVDKGKVPAGSSGTKLMEELKALGFREDQEYLKIPITKATGNFSLTVKYNATTNTEGDVSNPPFFVVGFNLPGAVAPYKLLHEEEE